RYWRHRLAVCDDPQQAELLGLLRVADDILAKQDCPDARQWLTCHGYFTASPDKSNVNSMISPVSVSVVRSGRSLSIRSIPASISLTRNGRPWILFKPSAGARYLARNSHTSCPAFNSGTRIFLYFLRTAAVFLGIGFKYRKWAWATFFPLRRVRSTAVVIEPYVPPQPTTSRSASASPVTARSGIVWAMFSIFLARVRTMFSWLDGS